MKEESFELVEVFSLLRRNAWLCLLMILGSLMVSFVLAKKLPKEFKSESVLGIQGSYFESPIAREMVGTFNDPRELQSQKLAMLQMALSTDFIDGLAEQYNIYTQPQGSLDRMKERERFMDRIGYFAISPTTFQIVVSASEADSAQEMNKAVLDQMVKTLFMARYKTLASVRNAIDEHVSQIAEALRQNPTSNPLMAQKAEALQAELSRLEGNISALLGKFTPKHPAVIDLKRKAESIRSVLKNTPVSTSEEVKRSGMVAEAPRASLQDLFNDLIKKLSYLNIALSMERDHSGVSYMGIVQEPSYPTGAAFPKLKVFLLVGALVGVLLSAISVTLSEVNRGSALTAESIAEVLEVPYLGRIPLLPAAMKIKLIDGPSAEAVRRRLPAPNEAG